MLPIQRALGVIDVSDTVDYVLERWAFSIWIGPAFLFLGSPTLLSLFSSLRLLHLPPPSLRRPPSPQFILTISSPTRVWMLFSYPPPSLGCHTKHGLPPSSGHDHIGGFNRWFCSQHQCGIASLRSQTHLWYVLWFFSGYPRSRPKVLRPPPGSPCSNVIV